METLTPLESRVARLMCGAMQQVLQDWSTMIGVELAVERLTGARWNDASELAAHLRGRCVTVETTMQGACEGPLFFLFPHHMAAELIGRMLMLPADEVERQKGVPMEPEGLEVFHEIANLLCGSANNYLRGRNGNLKVSQAVDHLRVHASLASSDETVALLPAGELLATIQSVNLGGRTYTPLQVLPMDLAVALEGQPGAPRATELDLGQG